MYYIYIDEAGRGPLAWPVYVGLIIEQVKTHITVRDTLDNFPARDISLYQDCKDSKILSEWQRNALYKTLIENKKICYAIVVGVVEGDQPTLAIGPWKTEIVLEVLLEF